MKDDCFGVWCGLAFFARTPAAVHCARPRLQALMVSAWHSANPMASENQ